MDDVRPYRENISTFVSAIENRLVKTILFDIDREPKFDLSSIPFHFLYTIQIQLDTEDSTYRLFTSQTNIGLDTFWADKNTAGVDRTLEELKVNSNVKVVSVGVDHGYVYKIHLQFNSQHLILITGNINENFDGSFTYKKQDEIILAFKDIESAEIFERLAECR
ncbi:MAG: hypothetical protein K2P88_07275 [Chitinophagaceae bacterium]|uniref:hypothetical protein n=1 Tax=unclassified Paraflavitalea TaxID=2798305 RepID=UPI003D356A19|nr:hypothetical protein [Chitinophagaceae bacterium]